MIKETKNISFKNGIVENFKQDNFTQADWLPGYQLTSVLFLNNYNPNIEYSSLSLRPGLKALLNYKKDKVLFTSAPAAQGQIFSVLNTYNTIKSLDLQHYTRINYVDSQSPFSKLDILLSSYILPNIYLPQYHEDPENLWVTSINYHGVDPVTNEEKWSFSFETSYRDGLFLSLGKFRDAHPIGSSLLYVTEPTNDLNKGGSYTPSGKKRKYYPVYLFEQIKDVRKIFKDALKEDNHTFMNGLDETILDDNFWNSLPLRKFRVKNPTPFFEEIKIASLRSAVTRNIKLQEHLDYYRGSNNKTEIPDNPESYAHVLRATYGSNSNNPADDALLDFSMFDDITDDMEKPMLQLLVWEQPLLWYKNPDNPYINELGGFGRLEYAQKMMGYTWFRNRQGTWSILSMLQDLALYDSTPSSNMAYKYPYIDSIESPKNPLIEKKIDKLTEWKKNTYTFNNVGLDVYEIGQSQKDQDNDLQRKIYNVKHVARFVCHDYIRVELPRPWMSGDKIPFIVTAILNGKETILLKEVYVVSKGLDSHLVTGRTIIDADAPFSHDKNDYTDLDNKIKPGYYLGYHKNIPRTLVSNSAHIADVNGLKENKNGIAPIDSMLLYGAYGLGAFTQPPGKFTTDLSGGHNTIQMTIRLNKQALSVLLSHGCTEIKVYASRPDTSKLLFDRIGSAALVDCPPMYCQPMIDEFGDKKVVEGNKYALVKTFVLNGETDLIEDYGDVNRSDYRINSWNYDNGWIYGVPLKEGTNEADVLKPLQFGNITYEEAKVTPSLKSPNFTPDFFLWDYPVGDGLPLGDSGKVWEGTGARCITVVKNRTFIAGVYDKNKIEEKGKIRWSSMNNGVHINDLFVEEANMDVGALPITALLNYREQLWIFNKDNYYRVMLNEIHNPITWEFVDAKFGQGTYSPKTLISTPYGVAFCGEGGIYMSDGTNPMNIVDNQEQVLAIKSLYQYIMFAKTNQYGKYTDFGKILLEEGQDYNIFAELFYDTKKDELVLTSPFKKNYGGDFDLRDTWTEGDPIRISDEYTELEKSVFKRYYDSDTHLANSHWLKLIYSFANKNWRLETGIYYSGVPLVTNLLTNYLSANTYAENGRVWENDRVCRNIIPLENAPVIDKDSASFNKRLFSTIYSEDVNEDMDNIKIMEDIDFGNRQVYIWGEVTTHEIGNGEDDYILMKAKVECSPKESAVDPKLNWQQYDYNNQNDPVFAYELRSRTWSSQTNKFNEIDLIKANMASKGGLNPFTSIMITPTSDTNATYLIEGDETMVGRETLNMIAPMSKFRRTRFRLLSKVIAKIRTITLEFKTFKRRNY